MTKVRVGTIISRNHAPGARVLAQSLARHHPELRLVTLVVDHDVYPMCAAEEPFDVLAPRDVGVDERELHELATIYDAKELCCALKPRLAQYLLSTGADAMLYLDSDMEVFSRLDDLFDLASSHSILLNPQISEPAPRDGLYPSELDFLGDGVYNFLGVGARAGSFLEWWGDRLRRYCLHEENMFGDQRWLDLVPCFYEHVVPRDPGYIVAWYSLGFRKIDLDADGRYRANGSLLRLFHYSYFDPEKPHLLHDWAPALPHRARLASQHPEVAALCQRYAARLMECGYREDSTIPYPFARATTGLVLDRRMRRLYRDALLDLPDPGAALPDPFSPTTANEFLQWLRDAGPWPAPVSRYLMRLYEERPDLQVAFPDLDGQDGARYLDWVRSGGQAEPSIPPELLPDR